MRWAVIELAGYEGENVRRPDFADEAEAFRWMERHYDADERESLHVDIAHWDEEGGFWSYDH